MALFHVPGCDGGTCRSNETQELRVLLVGGDGNAILCRNCYEEELHFRREHKGDPMPTPAWEDLKVYTAEPDLDVARYILWAPKDGEPTRDATGAIVTSGALGALSADNVYLTAYCQFPDKRRPTDLDVSERIAGVVFGLSGECGTYDLWRIR